jgi:adenylate cyclase, class 2
VAEDAADAPWFEVEAKLRLRDRAALELRLRALGARAGPPQWQEDTFFRHPQRDFAATDEALRLRRAGGALELTYKGPKAPGAGPKARVEHAVGVAADPTALLAGLGFTPAAQVAKERTPYELGGGVHVALDRLDGVGEFVEVEAVGPDRAAAALLVEEALRRLGLAGEPQVAASYLELSLAAGR